MTITRDFEVTRLLDDELDEILSPEAIDFVVELHRRFERAWHRILAARAQRDAALRAGWSLDFLPDTHGIRDDEWEVAPPRADYIDRRVEVIGPARRRTLVQGLNSGASGFMADLEDSLSPTWRNVVDAQRHLRDAADGSISVVDGDGILDLDLEPATLMVRPRGWHLPEWHVRVAGEPVAGALVDFGLYAFHCAEALLERGSALYLYLPKLEHHHEARLWSSIFAWTQKRLCLPFGSIRATVQVETLPAAFQMDEILWELRDYAYGLNAGRWDYLFSTIKCFRDRPEFVLPPRDQVTMREPFLRAYVGLLVETCHRRGTFAIGGMAPICASGPDDAGVAALRMDKRREAEEGFDGTWVARPDMVEIARGEFAFHGPNQIWRRGPRAKVTADDLLEVGTRCGCLTEDRLRRDIRAGFAYISSWLSGRGAADGDLPEDAVGAEICRAQIWQWIRHGAVLDDGRVVTRDLVSEILDEEIACMRAALSQEAWDRGRPEETRDIFTKVALEDDFPAFLTLPAYEALY